MKKILSIIFAVFAALTSVIPAFADVGPPPFMEFTVYVSKPQGTFTYDMDWDDETGTSSMKKLPVYIPYGTQLTVNGYYEMDGEEYGSVHYNNDFCYVKMSDVTFNNPVVGVDKATKLQQSQRYAVIVKNGAAVYNGPGFLYEMLSEKIPYGTEFECEYVDYEYDTMWAYVSVNGISGWIYVSGYDFGENNDVAKVIGENTNLTGKALVVAKGTELKESLDFDSKTLVKDIPAGTEFTFKYYHGFGRTVKVFVEYKGQKGWLVTSDRFTDNGVLAGTKGGAYILADKLPVYDKIPSDKNAEKVGEIKGNVSIAADYRYIEEDYTAKEYTSYEFCRISIDGKNYWISGSDDELTYAEGISEYKVTAANGLQMYAEPSENSKKLNVIPKGTTVKGSYWEYDEKDWRFVEYKGVGGWVIEQAGGLEYIRDTEKYPTTPLSASKAEFVSAKPVNATEKTTVKNETETTASTTAAGPETTIPAPAELTTAPETTADAVTEPATAPASPKTIVIACVAGAAVIAVTAAVTITLINKKKKER